MKVSIVASQENRDPIQVSFRVRRRDSSLREEVRLRIDPLFISPFAKGEIQWGFWQFC
jgi:hypothetical protein